MRQFFCRPVLLVACGLVAFGCVPAVHAHFLWLKALAVPDGAPQAFLYFGENADNEDYHFPDKLAAIKIWRRGNDGKRDEQEIGVHPGRDREAEAAAPPGDARPGLEVFGQCPQHDPVRGQREVASRRQRPERQDGRRTHASAPERQ